MLQLQTLGATGNPWFLGGGLGASVSLSLRTRLTVSGSAGVVAGGPAVRAEALASFHLNPPGSSGLNPYLAAGAALLTSSEAAERGFMVATLGLEARLARRLRGFGEGGLGGGFRGAAGLRVIP